MKNVIIAALSFAVGTAVGIVVGYELGKKKQEGSQYVEPILVEAKQEKVEHPNPEKTQRDIPENTFKSKPASIATAPGETGINYTKFLKDLKYKQESQTPPDDDPDDGPVDDEDYDDEMYRSEYEETYEERLERESKETSERVEEYKKEHKGKIEIMEPDDWDTDFPETDYERKDLYYFTGSDILTDESGHALLEDEWIGPTIRQIGWMQSSDDTICVRNHPKEMELRVFKERCSVEDWFQV